MATYYFERECRTAHSEVYNVLTDEDAVGRVDLHYASSMVHETLCVSEGLTQEMIQELIEEIDQELVDVVGVTRDEFIVHVHQGQDLGIYSNHNFGENGEAM